ncbi:MAG: hypothetical protein JOZ37_17170 [Actinobacteria bacterium]|nr:hypothetical protein [Actinomycetota bacterium]MBV9665699.1 hypothetical protein [Actinomycetota bacterium]
MRVRRLAVALAVPIAVIPTFLAQPADAHTLTGVQPTNFRSELVSVLPALPGVTVDILDLGRRIRLTNRGNIDVVIRGYQGEPYLRVGPAGVFENTHSPAVYLNKPAPPYATTSTTLPKVANSSAPPEWHRTSRSHTVTWHDRRTRWEGPSPPSVRSSPHDRQVVSPWLITVTRGKDDAAITGRILWVPPPSAVPWLALAVAFGLATAAAVFTRRWATFLAVALTVLVASDIVHSVASAWATHDGVGAVLFRVFVSGFYGTIAWVLGLSSIGLVARRNDLGLLLAGVTAFFLALLGGATDASSLGRSQLGFSLPADVARFQVALALGVGVGLVVAVTWMLARRDERVVRTRRPT